MLSTGERTGAEPGRQMRTSPAELRIGQLVDAAAQGDEGAWRQLVTRFQGLVWATARACGLAEADAADVTQTTWMRLAEQLGRIDTAEALPGWLVTTTRREAVKVAKRAKRPLPPRLLTGVDFDTGPSPAELVVAAERRDQVRTAFEQLGGRCRLLLALLSADVPFSYREIATQADIPVSHIGPTRRRCLGKLANLLGTHQSAVFSP